MKIQASLVVTGNKNKTANVTPKLHINEHNKNKMNSNSEKHRSLHSTELRAHTSGSGSDVIHGHFRP